MRLPKVFLLVLITLPSPVARVRYRFLQTRGRPLEERVMELLKG